MEILRKTEDQNILISAENQFKTDLGWQENFQELERETLLSIINPIENYETMRYIHKPYTSSNGVPQTDIWFYFYFIDSTGTGYTNGLDYELVGITAKENELMLKQSTESFFRLEFYKTSNDESPNQTNRRLVFSKNLILPLGEKVYFTGIPSGFTYPLNDFVNVPVFNGSNYRNTENMYLFWFADDSPFSETNITGNTFYMTVKYYNAKDGSVIDFVNKSMTLAEDIVEEEDVYYKVIIDRTDYSYIIYEYNGSIGSRRGQVVSPINFYERKK